MPHGERDFEQGRSFRILPAPVTDRTEQRTAMPNGLRLDPDHDLAWSISWRPITVYVAIGVIVTLDLFSLFFDLLHS